MEPNLTGMFLGLFSAKFVFFVPVGYSTWLPGPIICCDWLKFQRSSSLIFNLHSKWCILRHFKVVYKCMKKKVS
jgi:hypothetical protein